MSKHTDEYMASLEGQALVQQFSKPPKQKKLRDWMWGTWRTSAPTRREAKSILYKICKSQGRPLPEGEVYEVRKVRDSSGKIVDWKPRNGLTDTHD